MNAICGVVERKARVRAQVLRARKRLSPEARRAASEQIVERLDAIPTLAAARSVGGYAAFGSEVDVDSWSRAALQRGTRLALPFVCGPFMEVAEVDDLDRDLAAGWRGVREPLDARRIPLDPAALEGVIVPGVAFDRRGHRLGYGGGYFDRWLRRLRPGIPVVGVAFAVQVVAEVPVQRHDRRVDYLVTERGLLQCF